MDVIVRKRLCIIIYKKQSFTDRIMKRIVKSDSITKTGVTYEIVSNVPKVIYFPHCDWNLIDLRIKP